MTRYPVQLYFSFINPREADALEQQADLLEEFGSIDNEIKELFGLYIEGWTVYYKDTEEIMIIGPSETPWSTRWLWKVLWPVTKIKPDGPFHPMQLDGLKALRFMQLMAIPCMSIYTHQADGNYQIEIDCEDKAMNLSQLYKALKGYPFMEKKDG